ncbi:MAG: DMT family transporter [Mogibacterium sp.]|nr:DMT family transporter [Mogibacterium sp.]
MLFYFLGLLAGVASPTQASYNARIREDIRSAYIPALINFIVNSLLLAAAIIVIEKRLYIPLGEIAAQPFWIWLGGACGTTIIILNIVCVMKLGSARNVMLICFGQIMLGLIIDHFGMFYSPQIPMSMLRLLGAVLVIAGIVLVNGKDDGQVDGSASGGKLLLYIILAVICGFACSLQIAVNGTLNVYAGSALKATLISMMVGLISTGLVMLAVTLIKGPSGIYDEDDPSLRKPFRPWMLGASLLAIVVVGSNAIAAPAIGTGVVTILNIVGMMAMGLVIDAVGMFGTEKQPVTVVKVIGMLLMIAGAAIISLL